MGAGTAERSSERPGESSVCLGPGIPLLLDGLFYTHMYTQIQLALV